MTRDDSAARPGSILLVEDDPDDAYLTREALYRHNPDIHLSVIDNGRTALLSLRDGRTREPDLVLLDLNLPGMSGSEVLAEIKSDPQLRGIPVVILTTSSSPRDVERSYQQLANCYVTKPKDIATFREIVARLASYWFAVATLPGTAARSAAESEGGVGGGPRQ